MRLIIYLLPTIVLVAMSQLLLKWRMGALGQAWNSQGSLQSRLMEYLRDPVILSAYLAGLLGSFAWLFALSRLPMGLAFPVYQGLTFAIVVLGGSVLLSEPLTVPRLVCAGLILAGVLVGALE